METYEVKGRQFALVGCGKQSKKHIHVITNYIDGGSIAAVCDVDIERARTAAKECGAEPFSSIAEMMQKHAADLDVVNVLTPSGVHAENVKMLSPYGVPLVIEKPIALRLDEADQILRTCDNYGTRLFVVHQNRYNRPIVAAHKALDDGRFGKLVMGTVRVRWRRDQKYYDSASWRGTWAYDGGVFTNQASHHIDMLTWFMGDPVSVKAIAATRLVDIECEDTGAALVRFSNGSIGIVEATTAVRPKDLEGSISILGEKGSVVVGGFFMEQLETWQFEEPVPEDEAIFKTNGTNPEGWGYNLGEYLRDVLSSIDSGTKGLVDGLEGRKSLELISAIYESVETGEEVQLRFSPKQCKLGIR
jgi:UDP-N-acetyl-2-amino-2-deoxyglucuronate dehydrogenase